jgi:hypothetical protein
MKTLIWDYKTKRLLDCQDMKLDINMNPRVTFGTFGSSSKTYSDFCQLEFNLDNSYRDWLQEWLSSCTSNRISSSREYKRDLHLKNDIIFIGCIPKHVQLHDTHIEMMISCDHYNSSPFSNILEVHRELAIDEILSN